MKNTTLLAFAAAITAAPAVADTELNLFNFGLYTPPDLLERFEETYGIHVNLTEFDSNETAIARIQAGGHGLDAIVLSSYFIPAYLENGLLMESRPDQMEGFSNIASEWVAVAGDPDRHYTVPWVWTTTGVMVNTALYSGDINTAAIFLDPPEALRGSINVVPAMNDVIDMTVRYLGGEPCSTDMDLMRRVRDTLVEAKQYWASIDYTSFEKFVNEDINASVFWSGAASRIRAANPNFAFGWPREGYVLGHDNVAILADARNVEAARLFQEFVMQPENAALISNYTRYGNMITDSEAFMDADLLAAPELHVPEDLRGAAIEQSLCAPDVQAVYARIWTDLTR